MVQRCMDKLTISRRQVLRGALATASGVVQHSSTSASSGHGVGRSRRNAQDRTRLAVAMLDDHWKAIQPIAEQYATNADIELKVSALKHDELYTQLSLTLTQRANTFDIVSLTDAWIPQFATFLQPLDVPSDQASEFVSAAYDLGRYPADSPSSALPWLGEAQFFAMRPEWLELASQAPPSTWDGTVECASAVADQLEPDGDLAAFGIRSLDGHQLVESFLPILRGFGKNLIDTDTSIPQLDTSEALAAMQVFMDLAAYSPAESAAVDAPNNADRFAAGEIAMIADYWSSDLLAARTTTATAESGPLVSMLQPAQPASNHLAMTGVWLAGIPVGSAYPDGAMDFIDWLTSRAVQSQLPVLALPPVLVDVFQEPALIEQYPDLPTLFEMLETATPRSRSPYYPQLERLVATELQRALAGDQSGEQAMQNANISLREFLVREGVLAT